MPVVIQVSTPKYAIQHVYDCRQQTTAESLEGAMFHPVSLLEPAIDDGASFVGERALSGDCFWGHWKTSTHLVKLLEMVT